MSTLSRAVVVAGALAASAGWAAAQSPAHPALVSSQLIYDANAPTPQMHATTLVETPEGLVAAWFGGEYERHPQVKIYVSRHENGRWGDPVAVADGRQPDGTELPTWNPVLFQPTGGTLLLFYKVGPSPSTWWGMVMRSGDNGRTWSAPERLPEGILGPIKNKPEELPNGVILSGSSFEGEPGWRVHFERSADGGRTWTRTPIVNDPATIEAIQPTFLRHPDGRIQSIGRTQQNRTFSVESSDGGLTWGPTTLLDLPNPNSGIDAVTLRDGRHLVVYNHTVREDVGKGRGELHVALSRDGKAWEAALVLESEPTGEHSGFSYPAVIQTTDGRVHITYTWKRLRPKHVVLDPARLDSRPFENGAWPR